MTRDPDMIRVSARHLRRLLGRTLAPRVADGIVQEIMSRPEASHLVQGCAVRDEARRRDEAAARPQQRSGAEGGE